MHSQAQEQNGHGFSLPVPVPTLAPFLCGDLRLRDRKKAGRIISCGMALHYSSRVRVNTGSDTPNCVCVCVRVCVCVCEGVRKELSLHHPLFASSSYLLARTIPPLRSSGPGSVPTTITVLTRNPIDELLGKQKPQLTRKDNFTLHTVIHKNIHFLRANLAPCSCDPTIPPDLTGVHTPRTQHVRSTPRPHPHRPSSANPESFCSAPLTNCCLLSALHRRPTPEKAG